MSLENNKYSAAQSLAFFGAITASVTHELTNVISIINELTGLLDDMRYSAEQGQIIGSEKLGNLHGRLIKQIDRGEKIVKRLNRFAHTTDRVQMEFDVNKVLTNFVDLMRRSADLKRINFAFHPAETELRCTSNPFEFQHIIFQCCNLFLDLADAESSIVLDVEDKDHNTVIVINCSDVENEKMTGENLQPIKGLAENQGWDFEYMSQEKGFSFIISV